MSILKAYSFWGIKFSQVRKMVLTYNKGMIGILQRLLTVTNDEEESFWILIGLVKSMSDVLS